MKSFRNFSASLALAFATATSALHAAPVTSFDDIQIWVGSGSNQAGLVVDWNDGLEPVSLAWGFRWDGLATGQDMFEAISAADPRLTLQTFSFPFGDIVDLVTYELDGTAGISAADHDKGGTLFTTGFSWNYAIFEGLGSYPGVWDNMPQTGFSDRQLSDNSWDGWTWAEDFSGAVPTQAIAAIPEPATLALIVFALGAIAVTLRRRAT